MKKYSILLTVVVMLIASSCMKFNLEDLPLNDEAEIVSIRSVAHRYRDGKDPSNGGTEDRIVNRALTITAEQDTLNATWNVKCVIPSNIPEAERANVTLSNVVVSVGLSSAAIITPESGSPKLGVPGDFSSPRRYVVTAADGTKKSWTISLSLE